MKDKKVLVAISVGHHEKDQGAENKSFQLTEYKYNLEVADLIVKNLSKDFETVLIFNKELSQLPKAINETNADLCVSLHCNAFNRIASGTETLYYHSSTKGKRLASLVQERVLDALELRDRGIKPLENNDRGGYLLRKTTMPCIITEPAFIDNDVDCIVLMDNKQKLADAISEGIRDFTR